MRAGDEWQVEIESAGRQPAQPDLVLAVAAGDRERFTWMAEKAAELGVSEIVPLETGRSVTVSTRLRENHIAKLRRIVLEATKQCGAAWAPHLQAPVSLPEFLSRPLAGTGWVADLSGHIPPAELDETPLTVIVGPEGGLTAEERAAVLAAGYRAVTLGAHTLRFETAGLAAAAAAVTARMRGHHG